MASTAQVETELGQQLASLQGEVAELRLQLQDTTERAERLVGEHELAQTELASLREERGALDSRVRELEASMAESASTTTQSRNLAEAALEEEKNRSQDLERRLEVGGSTPLPLAARSCGGVTPKRAGAVSAAGGVQRGGRQGSRADWFEGGPHPGTRVCGGGARGGAPARLGPGGQAGGGLALKAIPRC